MRRGPWAGIRGWGARLRERGGQGLSRRALTVVLVGALVFSIYGTAIPAEARCQLPGRVACPGGLLGAPAPSTSPGEQWFDVILYDYGFWIVNTVDGVNESTAWYIYEGWTIHINATSRPPNVGLGGTGYHGLGVEINETGTILLVLAAPVGGWTNGSFVAPTQPYSHQHIWCTIACGPGHAGMQLYNLFVVPSTFVPSVTVSANRTSGEVPFSVAFSGSVVGGTPPVTSTWNFGDGTPPVSGPNATHTYTVAGNYSAVFSATDGRNVSVSRSVAIHVVPNAPLTVTLTGIPASGVAPLLVAAQATVTGGLPPYAIAWQLGDGSTGSGAIVDHLYSAPGEFGVQASVTDAAQRTVHAQASLAIRPSSGPVPVVILASPSSGTAPVSVAFTAAPTGGNGPYVIAWIFGDGSVAWGPTPNHTYSVVGSYEPTVFVTDASGLTGVNATTISVAGPSGTPLGSVLTEWPSSGPPPLSINATFSIFGGYGQYGTSKWNFGDGASGTGPLVAHMYPRLGEYNVTARGADVSGVSTINTTTVRVAGLDLQITLNRTSGDAPFEVSALGSVEGGSGSYDPVEWSWGDGNTSFGSPSIHIYDAGVVGSVVIHASVTDSGGNVSRASTTVNITPAPVATLTATLPPVPAFPERVVLTLVVEGGSGGNSAQALWSFGDGSTTRGPSPQSHTYDRPGHYQAVVTTNDSVGTVITATLWLNLSLGEVGGVTGTGRQWVFSGVSDPNQVALVLLGVVAASWLLLMYGGRRRPAAAAGTPASPTTPRRSR